MRIHKIPESSKIRVAVPRCRRYIHRMGITDLLLLLGLSAIWGSSFIFIRYLAPLIGPVATADFRMLLAGAALVLVFLAIRFASEWKKNWPHFLVIGVLNSAVPFALYSIAALYLP
ncbi:MAG TPA: EamA family transporter, partial [Spirochaetia bacterium]|nr:EamA family transporter [Spirochaetia bacterium]